MEVEIKTNITDAEKIFCFYKLGKEGSFLRKSKKNL